MGSRKSMTSTHPPVVLSARHQPDLDWVSLFAGVGMMALLGLVIDTGTDLISPQTLGVIAGLGYLTGFILAELRTHDLVAHFLSFAMGVVAALVSIEPNATWANLRTGAVGDLLRRNADRVEIMVNAIRNGDRLPDDVASAGIALTLWLVGYGAAWMLFRRSLYVWSVAMPACILLTSLALDRDQETWIVLGFLGLAIVQGVSATARARSYAWTMRGLSGPRPLSRLAIAGGISLAGIVVLTSLYSALTIPQKAQDWVVQHSQDLADSVTEQLDRLQDQQNGSSIQGNYGDFADEFKVGDGVPSGETLVASLRAADRHYLSARTLDHYDGAGWSTTINQQTGLDGGDFPGAPPRIAFDADQEMHLPASVIQSRNAVTGEVTLHGGSALLLTLESHLASTVPTAIQVGWQTVDVRLPIETVDFSEVPVDLQSMIGLLRLASFDEGDLATGTVTITNTRIAAMIDEEIERLQRYPVEASVEWTSEEGVVLVAAGRLPVYTDIQAVFSSRGAPVESYFVTGLTPNVDAATLAAASRTYPDHIAELYLQLPDTVSPRTRELAAQIVEAAGATDPYAMTVAIETHLRTSYAYLLEAGPAPDGQDIVDYFLFDSKIGRCDHFASSMVVMLRALGVPARIVTGFSPVEFDAAAGAFQYRSRNAHAWVEVYFSEYGWIPFEPTPSQQPIDLAGGATSQQAPIQPTPTAVAPTPDATQTPSPVPGVSPEAGTTDLPPDTIGSGGQRSLTSFPGVLLPIVLAIISVLGGLLLLWRWPLRALKPGASFYYRLQRLGALMGIGSDESMTPGEYAAQYSSMGPHYQRAATSIADAYTDERYGPEDDVATVAERGSTGWIELRRAALRWRPWNRKGTTE